VACGVSRSSAAESLEEIGVDDVSRPKVTMVELQPDVKQVCAAVVR